jgi:hypothetical protein
MVMDGLKALDSVAYIRFASVYKDFREAKDFEDFAGTVAEVGSVIESSSPLVILARPSSAKTSARPPARCSISGD